MKINQSFLAYSDGEICNAVKSDELKWLPNGSELVKETRNAPSDSASKPETYTSFSCSQDTLPEFAKNPIAPKHPDIIIAKLGPGQVCFAYLFISLIAYKSCLHDR